MTIWLTGELRALQGRSLGAALASRPEVERLGFRAYTMCTFSMPNAALDDFPAELALPMALAHFNSLDWTAVRSGLTVEALRTRGEIIADDGSRATFHAGAYLGNGLHEGAMSSAARVAKLLGGAAL